MTVEEKRHNELTELLGKNHDAIGKLNTAFQLHVQADDNTHERHSNRLADLEATAAATAAKVVTDQAATISTWRTRGWGVVASLGLALIVGLVTHWASTH